MRDRRNNNVPTQDQSRQSSRLLVRTLEIWQPRSTRKLDDEDAREIRENTAGFFRILGEWQAKDNGVAKEGDESAEQ